MLQVVKPLPLLMKTDTFIIDTPHIGATKWWIGGAAHSATHTVCYARLIVKDVDYGVKTFVVPLRDSNHNLLPGVAIGDIGAKMGRHGVDNGWIQFTEVRIPRFFMLQRWCKVDRQGNVTLPPLEQLSYISLWKVELVWLLILIELVLDTLPLP